MEIIVRGRHKNSLYEDGVVCGFLWTLTPRKGLRDTRGGTSANFLHSTARRNNSGSLPSGKWDCADKSLDRLRIKSRKPLSPGDLSGQVGTALDMLMDVNKRSPSGGRYCVSPIHCHLDSDSKNLRFFIGEGRSR